MSQRLFIGVFPAGIGYADSLREEHGDYKNLAFLSYSTLLLEFRKGRVPADLRSEIIAHAALIQARKGEQYQVSGCGQTVTLGK